MTIGFIFFKKICFLKGNNVQVSRSSLERIKIQSENEHIILHAAHTVNLPLEPNSMKKKNVLLPTLGESN